MLCAAAAAGFDGRGIGNVALPLPNFIEMELKRQEPLRRGIVNPKKEATVELEQRIQALEKEVKILKGEIQRTLVEIQENLPDKATPADRWEKRAWALALLNILLAVVLFTNISFFIPGSTAFGLDPTLASWVRALWVAIAFIWLLLQMYPLALLLETEDRQWQGVIWRNTMAVVRARPGMWVILTLVVLVVAIINTVVPAAWLIIALALLVAVGSMGARSMLELFRQQSRVHSRN
jgi:hypothetical protein